MGKLVGVAVLAGAVAVGGTLHLTTTARTRSDGHIASTHSVTLSRPALETGTGSPHSPRVGLLLYHLRFGSNLKRGEVARELKRLGTEAQSAIPQLVEFLTHRDDWWGRVRDEIEDVLVAMGEAAVPAALTLLRHEDRRAKESGVEVLARIRGEPAVPVVAPLLKDGRAGRHAAAWLARLGEPGRAALVSAVADEDVSLKVLKRAIARAGKSVAVPLAALLEAEDKTTRERAARMLQELGKNARPVAGVIVRALQDPNFGDRIPLVTLLPSLDEVPAAAVHATASLVRGLQLADLGVRIREIWASDRSPGELTLEERRLIHAGNRRDLEPLRVLAKLGPAAREALPALVAIMDAGDPVAASAAAAAHWRASGDPRTAVDYLITSFQDDSGGVSHPATVVLQEMGEEAAPAIPVLLRELESQNVYRISFASVALMQIGDAALPAVRQWLATTEDPAVPLGLVLRFGDKLGDDLVGRLGNDASEVLDLMNLGRPELTALSADEENPLPDLRRRLREPRGEQTDLVLYALRRLGKKAAPAVPELVALLDDEDRRLNAAEVLAAIGPAATDAVPALERYLEDPWHAARLAVVRALWRITSDVRYRDLAFQPDDADKGDVWALPLLLEYLSGRWLQGRKDAVRALERLGPAARPAAPDLACIATDVTEDEYLRDLARSALAAIIGGR